MVFKHIKKTSIVFVLVIAVIGSSAFAREGGEDTSSTESTTTQSSPEKETNTSQQSKQTLQEKSKQQKTQAEQAKRCEAIATLGTKLKSQVSERRQTIESKRETMSVKVEDRSMTGQQELEQKRQKWDAQREENFVKLREKAKTDTQKAAVEDYISSIKQAIAARRAANDLAISTFVTNVAALKNQAQSEATQYTLATSSAINDAVVKATTDCNAGNDPQVVKATLKKTIDTIRKNAKNERQTGKAKTQIELLAKQRRENIKTNNENFKVATQKAREALLEAFNKTEQTVIE